MSTNRVDRFFETIRRKQMSINYQKYQQDVYYTYNNLMDALEDFKRSNNKENREEVLYRIGDLRQSLTMLKITISNIYLR